MAANNKISSVFAPFQPCFTKSIEVDGVVYFFNKYVRCILAMDGTGVAESSEDFDIIGTYPPSVIKDGYWAHGLMESPVMLVKQGADEIAGTASPSVGALAWDINLNIDPGCTGQPIHITAGQARSFIKAVRLPEITGPDQILTILKYIAFSVVPVLPPFGSPRPGMSATNKVLYPLPLKTDILQSLDFPSTLLTLAQCQERDHIRRTSPLWGNPESASETLRRMQSENSSYSSEFGITRGNALIALHSNIPYEEKDEYFKRAVQHGIDVDSANLNGFTGNAGAGQNFGYHPYHFYAAFALNDAAMLDRAQKLLSNMVSQNFYPKDYNVGVASGWRSDPGASYARYRQTIFDREVGETQWNSEAMPGNFNPRGYDTGMQSRYRNVGDGAALSELMAVMLLVNGPGGINGIDALLGCVHETGKCAMDYLGKIVSWTPKSYSGATWTNGARDTYFAIRPTLPYRMPVARPQQLPKDGHFSAREGGGAWDFLNAGYSIDAVIRKDARVSLDYRSFIELLDVADTGVISNLIPGLQHFGQLRQVSAYGIGEWSRVEPGLNVFTPTGAPNPSAPVNTLLPAIFNRPYRNWLGPWYEPCENPVPLTQGRLYAGVGYWSGFPGPVFTYQWKRNGVNITGENLDYYNRKPIDAGANISCTITATNSSGNASATTPEVTIPSQVVKTSYYVAQGVLGVSLDYFVSVWNNQGWPIYYDDGYGKTVPAIYIGGGSGAGADNNFHRWVTAEIVGDLSDVPEGELLLFTDYGGSKNYPQANGVVFRATGADGSVATGYIVELQYADGGATTNIVITRVLNGTRTTMLTHQMVGDQVGNVMQMNRMRVNWSIVTGSLVIKVKAWMDRNEQFVNNPAPPEPIAWDATWTDPTPLPSGGLGLGQVRSRSARRSMGIGLSIDPSIPAPLNP